ncbi:MAG: Crp/Fnr family transcriptional regulator [Salinivirgaceae bacterium]|jgi:CRP-like cAMP-binding protein|nr:Crp/Fnr family transcriptional regulator [Salinivirgaceae bacterium]
MKNTSSVPECKDCMKANKRIFSTLTEEELDKLTYDKTCSTYKKGSTIFHEGNRIHHFYCVFSGIVKMYKTGIEGKDQIVAFAKYGDIIGYRSILSKEPACTTAKAIEEVVLCVLSAKNMFEFVENNNKFSMELMQMACRELGEANQFLTDIAQKSVRERLAEVIVKLKEIFSVDADGFLKVSLTREELANLVGTATESVIRLLSEFKTDKYIDLKGRKIRILNEEQLRKISNYY